MMMSMLTRQHTHHHHVHHADLLSPEVNFLLSGTFCCVTIFAPGAHFKLTLAEHELHHVLECYVILSIVTGMPILPFLFASLCDFRNQKSLTV
jgi:hypothetical protein